MMDEFDLMGMILSQRKHFVQEPTSNPVKRAIAALTEEAFDYGKADIFFDFSLWQQKADKTTSVDWKGLAAYDQVIGGYCKMGEAYTTAAPQTIEADRWFDPTWNSNFAGMVNNRMWSAGYILRHGAWPSDYGLDENALNRVWDGTIDEVCTKLVKTSPNLYIAVRTMKPGVGRVFDAARMKDYDDWNGDELIWDEEWPWDVHNNVCGDGWLARSLDFDTRGAAFLMDNGCMPKHRQILYTSNYVIESFGKVYLRDVVARFDTICAGYYYDRAKAGYIYVKDIPALQAELAKFRQTWHPIHVGAGVPGKIVFGYQVADNFTMPYVPNGSGGYSAVDVNVSRISREALYGLYPKFAARRKALTPAPLPGPGEGTPTMGTVVGKLGVNVRYGPSTSKGVLGLLPKGFTVDVLEKTAVGNDVWIRVARGLWCCARQGTNNLIELK